MNFKKTVLASAIALAISGGSVLATTSTKSGQFILDKTEITAGAEGIVNMALLGLDIEGKVDRYGEENGSVIMAVVTSEKGEVMNGSSQPGRTPAAEEPYGGSFAAEVKYVVLNQGIGSVHIMYDPKVIGKTAITDNVTVKLQERIPTDRGGVEFKDIGVAVTKNIIVNPPNIDPMSLRITGFTKAPGDDEFGTSSTVSMDSLEGIQGSMMAGVDGGQIIVEAGNPNAIGDVTVNLRSVNGSQEYTFNQSMVNGKAIITLDDSVQSTGSSMPTGKYYIEATFAGFDGDSIQLVNPDILIVHSTGEVRKVSISSDRTRISKRVNAEQGVHIFAHVEDQYGNPTTADVNYNINLQDSNKRVSNTAVKLKIAENTSYSISIGGDNVIGNENDEVIELGTASIIGVAVDSQSTAIGAVSPSDPIELGVVSDSLTAEVDSDFSSAKLAGEEFNAFKNVRVRSGSNGNEIFNADEGNYFDPGAVIITNTSTGESITVNRSSDGKDIIKGLFKKSTSGDWYLLSDQAGNFAEIEIQAHSINVAAASKVDMRNAHGKIVTSVQSIETADEKNYIASIPELALKMFDSFGNKVTGSPVNKEITGEVRGTTANGKISYNTSEGNYGVPGRDISHNSGFAGKTDIIAKYNISGTGAFAGEDRIGLTFTKPGLGSDSLGVSTVVPKLQELGSINTYIETNSIPVNSVVAFTVETLDKDGKLFDKKKTVITVDINGNDDDDIEPTIRELNGGVITSGQSVTFDSGRKVFVIEAGPKVGKFSVSFKEANNAVEEASRAFNVTTNTVIVPTKTKEECDTDGDSWNTNTESCTVIPESGTSIGIGPDGGTIETTASFKGGVKAGSGAMEQVGTVSISEMPTDMIFAGSVTFDANDNEKTVDLITAVIYDIAFPLSGTLYYDLTGPGALDLWDGAPATLSAYKEAHKIDTVNEKTVTMPLYNGTFNAVDVVPGTVKVYLGYRLDNGAIKFSGEPIILNLNP